MEKEIKIKIKTTADGKGFEVTTSGLKKTQSEVIKTSKTIKAADQNMGELLWKIYIIGVNFIIFIIVIHNNYLINIF